MINRSGCTRTGSDILKIESHDQPIRDETNQVSPLKVVFWNGRIKDHSFDNSPKLLLLSCTLLIMLIIHYVYSTPILDSVCVCVCVCV